ncbi:MAG: hypothetical protein OEY48_01600 [Gammaproteobacteria bacterium]|nr:hypothetical protein [Gammaproteobacteria bacterium]MDH5591525.1 hypothetical protein [Gammaproteobacteria bacterium]
MDMWLYILIIVLALSIWFMLNKHSQKPAHHINTREKNFHGVSIHPCSNACEAVSHLERKRFLAREVTVLPVSGCTAKNCTCTYIHYDDRRSEQDRRYPSIEMKNVSTNHNHRTGSERRRHSFA